MTKLKAIGSSIIFQFTNETSSGRFIEKSAGRIILTNQNLDEQGKFARWAKVVSIGTDVKDVEVGQFVLIEALQWTMKHEFEGQAYWRTTEDKILATSDSERDTFAY